jgi:hypothetical protein
MIVASRGAGGIALTVRNTSVVFAQLLAALIGEHAPGAAARPDRSS